MKMLPYKYKIPGIMLVAGGLVLAVLYFTIRLRFELPVLALISSYMETRFFATFKTNFADETILLLLLIGLSLWVFSKEKRETANLHNLRIKALVMALITDLVILLFSVLFFYGGAFVAVLVLNLVFPFVLYLVYFYILKLRRGKENP